MRVSVLCSHSGNHSQPTGTAQCVCVCVRGRKSRGLRTEPQCDSSPKRESGYKTIRERTLSLMTSNPRQSLWELHEAGSYPPRRTVRQPTPRAPNASTIAKGWLWALEFFLRYTIRSRRLCSASPVPGVVRLFGRTEWELAIR